MRTTSAFLIIISAFILLCNKPNDLEKTKQNHNLKQQLITNHYYLMICLRNSKLILWEVRKILTTLWCNLKLMTLLIIIPTHLIILCKPTWNGKRNIRGIRLAFYFKEVTASAFNWKMIIQ